MKQKRLEDHAWRDRTPGFPEFFLNTDGLEDQGGSSGEEVSLILLSSQRLWGIGGGMNHSRKRYFWGNESGAYLAYR